MYGSLSKHGYAALNDKHTNKCAFCRSLFGTATLTYIRQMCCNNLFFSSSKVVCIRSENGVLLIEKTFYEKLRLFFCCCCFEKHLELCVLGQSLACALSLTLIRHFVLRVVVLLYFGLYCIAFDTAIRRMSRLTNLCVCMHVCVIILYRVYPTRSQQFSNAAVYL